MLIPFTPPDMQIAAPQIRQGRNLARFTVVIFKSGSLPVGTGTVGHFHFYPEIGLDKVKKKRHLTLS